MKILNKPIKKIFILGAAGSGKTHLAKILSKKLKIPHHDLDDIKWKIKYTEKRNRLEKIKFIKKITKKNKWIIEGPYTSFISLAVEKSDLIIWLNLNKNTLGYRILKRYLRREREIKNSLFYTLKLIKTIRKYKKKNPHFESHKDSLKKSMNKTIIIKKRKELKKLIEQIKPNHL
jgi:adenylate kinase family enzyme